MNKRTEFNVSIKYQTDANVKVTFGDERTKVYKLFKSIPISNFPCETEDETKHMMELASNHIRRYTNE